MYRGMLILLSTMVLCSGFFGCQKEYDSSHNHEKPDVVETLTIEEKNKIHQEYFSNTAFHEIESIPAYIHQQIPFVPIRTYQHNMKLYFVVNPRLKATDTELITNLKVSSDYGGCSEIWTWDIEKETLQRKFVKLEYYPNPTAKSTDSTPVDKIGTVHGTITTIDEITANEEIFFTESIAEGMMHFTKIQYIYRPLSDDILTVEYQPGRPEVYTDQEIEKMKEVSVTKETLTLFRQISDIVWENLSNDLQWSYFHLDRLYSIQYNIISYDDQFGEYYHEISYFSLSDQKQHPILRKWIVDVDLDPLISLEIIPNSFHLSISDWCGFSEEPRTHQMYYYNSDEDSIQLMNEAPNTTEETGVYTIVK